VVVVEAEVARHPPQPARHLIRVGISKGHSLMRPVVNAITEK
jgi:hypothetical protein